MPTPPLIVGPHNAKAAPAATGHRRRALLASLACGLALNGPVARAFDFSLPSFEDLRPKWAAVSVGDSIDQVQQRMGSPNTRTETQVLGVPQTALAWKDVRGYRYTARFLAGLLYAKELTDAH